MICCDLCGKTTDCIKKEIDGKEFDLCYRCWHPLEDKLGGKGRVKSSFARVEEEAQVEEYEETTI